MIVMVLRSRLWERRDAPWSGAEVRAEWAVLELAPRSSYFATLHKQMKVDINKIMVACSILTPPV